MNSFGPTAGFSGFRHAAQGSVFWYEGVHRSRADASCRYRLGHLVEHLSGATVVIDTRLPDAACARANVVTCLRPALTPPLSRTLEKLRRRGVTLVADFDDLVFAGEVPGLPPNLRPRRPGAPLLAQYAAALEAFDRFSVSTRALAERLHALRSDAAVTVIPNGMSHNWVTFGRALHRRWQPGDPLVIRYLPGSPSHDEDFKVVADVLARFLKEHPQVRLEIVGLLDFDVSAFPPEQVSRRPRVSFDGVAGLLSRSWLCIAPLVSNEFNRCKSAIKALEAAAFDCPTLASPNDDLQRHVENGAPFRVCHDPMQWYDELVAMLNPEHRMQVGQSSGRYTSDHAMASSSVERWLEAFYPQRSACRASA